MSFKKAVLYFLMYIQLKNSAHHVINLNVLFILMYNRITTFFIVFFVSFNIFSQALQLSKHAKVSVITYGPGEALYEKFGHTAIRIQDPMLHLDIVYNYGIFDVTKADFYVNFVKGYMKYRLVRYPFPLSLKQYSQHRRWVKEQVLNITVEQKNTFFSFLEHNAQPEYASYFYDPFFDNCSTRPRDIINDILKEVIVYTRDFITDSHSIRELMNHEIHPNTWGSVGINIISGNQLDQIATSNEYMYLPDYVFATLANAQIIQNGKKENFVLETNTLLDFPEKKLHSDMVSPFMIFMILLSISIIITINDIKKQTRTQWLDVILCITTGLLGLLIVFLWFFTNHATGPNNFNFLWAFAPNLLLAFFIYKKTPPKWVAMYLQLLLFLLCFLPFIWMFNIQSFPYVIIPFLMVLGIRYWYMLNTIKNFE